MQRATAPKLRNINQLPAVEIELVHPDFRHFLRQTSAFVVGEQEHCPPELVARKIEHGPQIEILQINRAKIDGAAFDAVQVLAGRKQIECSSRTLVQLVLPTEHKAEGQSAERAEPRLSRA